MKRSAEHTDLFEETAATEGNGNGARSPAAAAEKAAPRIPDATAAAQPETADVATATGVERPVPQLSAVRIRKIAIHRALGIRQAFELPDLSPGINLLFGSNGSGKSTTCRVVQELLWPGHLHRPTASGVVLDGDDEWRIDLDAGHVQAFRNGRPGTAPEFGPDGHRTRYYLGLRDLIHDEHSDFAKAVADASQGGYDVDGAASVLGFRENPRRGRKESEDMQRLQADVMAAQGKQLDVQRDALRQARLRKDLEEALEAEKELELLHRTREYRTAEEACRELEQELGAFPEGVGLLRGDERKRLDELAGERTRRMQELSTEEERIRGAETDLAEARLPDDVSDERLHELRAARNELRTIELALREQGQRRDEAAKEARKALRRLGDRVAEERLASVSSLQDTNLTSFARKVDRLHAAEEVLRERRKWVDAEEGEATQSLDEKEIDEGIHALARWLATPESEGRRGRSIVALVAVLVLLLLGLGLAVTIHWAWILLSLLAAGLAGFEWWTVRFSSRDAGTSAREVHRQTYTGLSLSEPERWEVAAVSQRLRELVHSAAAKAIYLERRSHLRQIETEAEALDRLRDEVEGDRRQLENLLGFALEIDEAWVPLLVDRLSAWQGTTDRLHGTEAALTSLEKERSTLLDRINGWLAAVGYASAGSSSAVAYAAAGTSEAVDEHVADLEERRRNRRSALDALKEARRRIDETIVPALETVETQRKEIYARLGVTEAEETLLDDWLERRPAFVERKETLAGQEAVCEDRRNALAGRTDLLELDRHDLEQRIRECTDIAGRRDEINAEMVRIRLEIERAKAGHELSDALEARDAALSALEVAREKNGLAVAGTVLTDWIQREAIERSRPRVFQRANELFVRFTRGTLQLELDDGSPPSFVARRGSLPRQSVNELSDGERIQLMTAVRLAFLEQDEARPLPILLDEVLGTSDDGRSGVMIDTIMDVARDGRQVFYCTAQHDEVAKWVARLEDSDVPFKLLDLDEVRGRAAARERPLRIESVDAPIPPEPNGRSYAEYGEVLGVPDVDPTAEAIDGLHLWHLLDDVDVLHAFLCMHVSTWGQIRTLLDHGGTGLVGVDPRVLDRARAAARAIDAACEAWRIGRGRPVDRAALMDSGCVSDVFIDRLSKLAGTLNGRAQDLLDALEAGRVARWQSRNTDALRDFFEDEGYLPMASPLTPQNHRVRVLAAIADEVRTGVLERAFVDRLVESLFRKS